MKNKGFSTLCVHSGEKDKYEYDVIPPIHLSSTFILKDEEQKYIYTRSDNPTREILEEKISVIEHGVASLAFSSGMAAISTVVQSFLNPGDEIILSEDIYSGTRILMKDILVNKGINYKFIDTRDTKLLKSAITPKTKMILIETPSNPLLRITDISDVSVISSTNNIKLVVDNTFASPYIQNPLELGADITIHSATKYLGGHSDVIAGTATFKYLEDYEKVKMHRSRFGGSLSPFDSYLLIRSIKTLGLRMEKHCENAYKIAKFLEEHPLVKSVYYPFLKSFPQYELSRKQMKKGGGMVSFRLAFNEEIKIDKFLKNLKIIETAVSLGGVESLIETPYNMTHRSLSDNDKKKLSITPELVRLSVGIEDVEDLIQDIDYALNHL